LKIRKWHQTKRDKDIVIELELSFYELLNLINDQSAAGMETRSRLLDLIMPILDEAEEPS